jgi:hypothetical protein
MEISFQEVLRLEKKMKVRVERLELRALYIYVFSKMSEEDREKELMKWQNYGSVK